MRISKLIEWPTSVELAPFVASIIVRLGPDDRPQFLAADGTTSMVFLISNSDALRESGLHAVGPRSRAVRKSFSDFAIAIAVRFRPGWGQAFLGAPLHELRDQHVRLGDLWEAGGRRFSDTLTDDPSIEMVVADLEAALIERSRFLDDGLRSRAQRVLHAASLLAMPPLDNVSGIDNAAKAVGLGPRQLRRLFAEVIGLSPMVFRQVVRFQRATQLAKRHPRRGWAVIALEAGYHDQAHMIGAFRRSPALPPWRGGPENPGRRKDTYRNSTAKYRA